MPTRASTKRGWALRNRSRASSSLCRRCRPRQIAPKVRPTCTEELKAQLVETDGRWAVHDLRALFTHFLGYDRPGCLVERDALPKALSFYAPEGRQEIRPSFAIARQPKASMSDAADDPFAIFQTPAEHPAVDDDMLVDESGVREKEEVVPADSGIFAKDGSAKDGSAKDGFDGPGGPRAKAESSPYLALVWELASDADFDAAMQVDLDKPEATTGTWNYPPTLKLERLLRHTDVPIGFISNGRALRVLYAPKGEASAHLTFRFDDLCERAGRPLVAALELLFHARRTYGAAPQYTFEGLLRESRERQVEVTKDLAAQVFEAVEILLEGFEHAAARDCVGEQVDWLTGALDEPGDHLYQGILSVVLRLVFVLYAEDQSLVPVHHPTYAEHLSVQSLYERLAEDDGAHPESMHLRFGAYGQLIALFRAIYVGVHHADLHLPPRRGKLFDPSAYPFLEGGLPGWTAAVSLPEEREAVQLPSLSDETIFHVLHRLVVFEGQRLSYRSLDVEQIGAVYESLMGYQVLRTRSPAVRLGKHRVWVETDAARAMKPAERKKLWKETCGLSTGAQKKAEAAAKTAKEDGAFVEELAALTSASKRDRHRHRVAADRLVVQPTEARRRSGSHYTPRWLSEKVVKRTLEPILSCLGEERTAEQILSLKICDPAMGSGAFLVAACRLLAEEVVAAWERAGVRAALTEQHGDALLHARRLVAQRCLYGVDKNPAAVELAKLSLWLVTLSDRLPFTFVDHALRHGDSLVGLDLEQIRGFHWQPKQQLDLCQPLLTDALEQALEHRDKILALAQEEDAKSQSRKLRLLEYAEQALDKARMVADACVGAFFSKDKAKARELERNARLELLRRYLGGDESVEPELEALAQEIRREHAPFHWMLEFPEVFYRERPDPLQNGGTEAPAFMEAVVGNPPFMGVANITVSEGEGYVPWLQTVFPSATGKFDLCAEFILQAARLLGEHGCMGVIGTNTIAQGDTRETGLKTLVRRGFELYDATCSMPWPGDSAAVTVSIVHGAIGSPTAHLQTRRIDDVAVSYVNSRLRGKPERADAVRLQASSDCSYQGSIILGMGFTLTPEERDALTAKNRKNAERIFPYLGGQEVNTSPIHAYERFVIDLGQMSLEEAEDYPDLMKIVREKVKPERDKLRRDALRKKWWLFADYRPGLRKAIAPLDRCLVNSQVSKHLVFAFQPTDRIFSHALYVYPLEPYAAFATLQSRVHEGWARLLSSSLEDRLRYAPSDCFETFPFPQPDPRTEIAELEDIGGRLYETRASYMVDTDQGLTKTYNALKDPTHDAPRIVALRALHEELDRAVLRAYGWDDIVVPPFCLKSDADKQALQAFEDEVIDRLYVLNAERAAQEAAGKVVRGKRARAKPEQQPASVRKSRKKPGLATARSTEAAKPTRSKSKKAASKEGAAKKGPAKIEPGRKGKTKSATRRRTATNKAAKG